MRTIQASSTVQVEPATQVVAPANDISMSRVTSGMGGCTYPTQCHRIAAISEEGIQSVGTTSMTLGGRSTHGRLSGNNRDKTKKSCEVQHCEDRVKRLKLSE